MTKQPPSTTLSVVSNQGLLAQTTLPTAGHAVGNRKETTVVSPPSSANSATIGETDLLEAEAVNGATSSTGNEDQSSLDFISTAPAVKTLFSFPMAEGPTCVAVHNLDGTLLLDEVVPDEEDEEYYEKGQPWQRKNTRHHAESRTESRTKIPLLPPSSQSLALALSPAAVNSPPDSSVAKPSSMNTVPPAPSTALVEQNEAIKVLSTLIQVYSQQYDKYHERVDDDSDGESTNPLDSPHQSIDSAMLALPPLGPSPVREYVEWQFQDLNLLVGSDALVVRPPPSKSSTTSDSTSTESSGVVIRVEEVNELRAKMMELQQRQQQQQQQNLRQIEEEKRSESPITRQSQQRTYVQALLQDTPSNQSKETNNSTSKEYDDGTDTETNGDSSTNGEAPTSSTPLNLDQVQLQTCIVPTSRPLSGWVQNVFPLNAPTLDSSGPYPMPGASQSPSSSFSSKYIVLDAYLDNLMANVPQLALCLQEKGLIQSVKLLDRDQIPTMMMHPSTLDTTNPIETVPRRASNNANNVGTTSSAPDLFSPEIMEMNATALLRFLKANCTSNNTTYLLRTDGTSSKTGSGNIQLYDISSISQQRQKKWIWWLATMSYRFALRLRQLETHDVLPMRQRAFRDRQRSLLQTTLDLLQDLFDMDGNAHESMVASVREHMADTFLGETLASAESSSSPSKPGTDVFSSSDGSSGEPDGRSPPPVMSSSTAAPARVMRTSSPTKVLGPHPLPSQPEGGPAINSTTTTSDHPKPQPTSVDPPKQQVHKHQPYSSITTDALNKAQDHLLLGIKVLWPVLESQLKKSFAGANENATINGKHRRRRRGQKNSTTHMEDTDSEDSPSSAMVSQLFGMKFKVVNVTLRLAEQYLGQYSGSNAMRSLRGAARRMADAIMLLEYLPNPLVWIPRLHLQYIWLWEHCGHFARSFASDNLWRERGHAAGDDVLYVLRDVEAAFSDTALPYDFSRFPDPLRSKTKGQVSLQSLSAICTLNIGQRNKRSSSEEGALLDEARRLLSNQGQLQRDKRQVLVASCIAYSRAIRAFQELVDNGDKGATLHFDTDNVLNLLRQRLGDACNETGKVLLAFLRTMLTKGSIGTPKLADVLLDSAQFWFLEGLESFQSCADLRNVALLRCNLCQCFKLRANATFTSQAIGDAPHAEVCLEKAISHLQAAHEALGTREVDPMTWDMVSGELAATFLVLAVRRRQALLGGGTTPVVSDALRLTPGKERSITEPMEKALAIYQQAGNFHQAAAVHYQLALTNSKIWTCQRDEAKTREKLSASFQQYNEAFAYFSSNLRGNEPTFVLLCLDIASLYAAVSGEECLVKALTRCLDTQDAFSQEAIDGAGNSTEWLEKMTTLASSLEDRVFKLLRSLVKLDGDRWKNLYRSGLAAKMVRNVPENDLEVSTPIRSLLAVHDVLVALQKSINMK